MRYLVVVDMQNDFIDGALGTPEAQAIVPRVVKKIEEFGGAIFYTMDTHGENYLDTQEGKLLPVKHCIYKTDGWKANLLVAGALQRKEDALVRVHGFRKATFGSVELGEQLRLQYEYARSKNGASQDSCFEIVLVGLCTDICVISNALLLKAFLPEAKITVDASCCAGVTPERHRNALEAMKACQIFIENEVAE